MVTLAQAEIKRIEQACVKEIAEDTPTYEPFEAELTYYEHCALHHGRKEFAKQILEIINGL